MVWPFIALKHFPCRQKQIFKMIYACGFPKWIKYVENWISLVVIDHNKSEDQHKEVYGTKSSKQGCFM